MRQEKKPVRKISVRELSFTANYTYKLIHGEKLD